MADGELSETSKGCKSILPKEKDCSDNEESGWTSYLEDFLSDGKNDQHNSSLSPGNESPNSLVSDAASFVGKRFVDKNGKKRLSIKKRMKTKGALVDFDGHDQALQDTASSTTANSLKEKSNSISGAQTNERSLGCLGMVGKPDNDSTKFKKKGLWQ